MPENRKMVRVSEKGYEGVACDSCGWVHPYPRMVEGCVEPLEEMKAAFHAHRCEQKPRPKKTAKT